MRSSQVIIGDNIRASQYNLLRNDAVGGSFLFPHEQSSPDLTLRVEAGVCYVGAIRVIYAAGNSPSFTAPSSNPRIDLLTIDNSGTLGRTAGSEGASPSVPTYPNDKLVIAEVYCRVGQTTIRDTDQGSNGYIKQDVRPFLGGAFIASNNQISASAAIQPSKLDAGNVDTDWLPDADNTRKLGSSSRQWSELRAALLYGDGSNLSNLSVLKSDYTFTAGEALSAGDAIAAGFYQPGGGVLFDNKFGGTITGSTTYTQSFTVGSNSNRILLVFINQQQQGIDITNVQYNGVALTTITTSSSNQKTYAGYLIAPSTGSNNLVFTCSGGTLPYSLIIYSFYNAKQTSQPDNSAVVSNTSSPATITPTVDGCLVVGAVFNGSTGAGLSSSINTENVVSITNHGAAGDAGTIVPKQPISESGQDGGWGGNAHIVSITPLNAVSSAVVKASATPGSTSNYRTTAFIGFAQSTVAAGASVKVTTGGIMTGFSGLLAFAQYYLGNTNGSIGTSAGTISRKIGIAITDTLLLITNIW